MAAVTLNAGKFWFPGTGLVSVATQSVTLADSVTAETGDGNYTISMQPSGTPVVTKGKPPGRSSTLQTIATAVVTNNGANVFLRDRRNLQVPVEAANHVVSPTPNTSDGTYLQPGVVTPSSLSTAVLALMSTVPFGTSYPSSPHQGQQFFRSDLGTLAIFFGSAWVVIGPPTGPTILGSGTSDPASGMIEGDLFYRSDLPALRVYTGSAWASV